LFSGVLCLAPQQIIPLPYMFPHPKQHPSPQLLTRTLRSPCCTFAPHIRGIEASRDPHKNDPSFGKVASYGVILAWLLAVGHLPHANELSSINILDMHAARAALRRVGGALHHLDVNLTRMLSRPRYVSAFPRHSDSIVILIAHSRTQSGSLCIVIEPLDCMGEAPLRSFLTLLLRSVFFGLVWSSWYRLRIQVSNANCRISKSRPSVIPSGKTSKIIK
jgi:hypothetical protein